MIALMYDGLELGTFFRDEHDVLRFKSHDNIPASWLPYIFYINSDCDMEVIVKAWVNDRVFPKNRLGSWRMVRKLGLKKYDAVKIAEITRCSVITDPYWIAYEETDRFSTHSIRGKMENEEYPYNSLDIKNEEDYIWRI